MKEIYVEYAIQRNGETIFEGEATVNLSEQEVQNISEYILADKQHQTAEFMDIPSEIYDSILDQVSDDAIEQTHGALSENDDIGIQTYLPVSLVELLPEEVIDTFPKEMFSETEDDEDSVQFLMDIEDTFLIKGRGVAFAGTIIGGACKVGDTVLLIDENDEVVAESVVGSIKVGRSIIKDLNEMEDTEGEEVSILTKIQSRKDAKGAVSLIVE